MGHSGAFAAYFIIINAVLTIPAAALIGYLSLKLEKIEEVVPYERKLLITSTAAFIIMTVMQIVTNSLFFANLLL